LRLFLCRKEEKDGNGEISTNEKRVWEEEDDQLDVNNKRTRTDLIGETGSGR
jgi:hypothetical protein